MRVSRTRLSAGVAATLAAIATRVTAEELSADQRETDDQWDNFVWAFCAGTIPVLVIWLFMIVKKKRFYQKIEPTIHTYAVFGILSFLSFLSTLFWTIFVKKCDDDQDPSPYMMAGVFGIVLSPLIFWWWGEGVVAFYRLVVAGSHASCAGNWTKFEEVMFATSLIIGLARAFIYFYEKKWQEKAASQKTAIAVSQFTNPDPRVQPTAAPPAQAQP
eukprot:GFYU01002712.1.p1 GENE.GFYU01002712.1~~GFYU01002712.1.p1  ORF type:complete len:216 (-),score=58.86 GFYU01002712.1:126-773(-)